MFACHQRTLGSHELTYLGDLIFVTVDVSVCKSCPNLKISFLFSIVSVLYNCLVTSKGTIGRSLGSQETDLQR